jgi:hypothetical protein
MWPLSMLLQSNTFSGADVPELGTLGLNLVLVLLLGQILGWHFVRFAQVLSNKRKLARVLMFIAATTLLIITVVGSSLALSLGLVGALSIIRFRTPVKEPEELAYLFLAIAVGVGLGANRPYETMLVFFILLLAMALRSGMPSGKAPLRTVLQIDAVGQPEQQETLDVLLPAVSGQCQRVELRRVDCHDDEFHASLLIEVQGAGSLQAMINAVRQVLPGASVSLVERDSLE